VVQHLERFTIRIVSGEAANADGDVGLVDRATERRERTRGRHRWHALGRRNLPRRPEPRVDGTDDRVVLDEPGRGHHIGRRAVPLGEERTDVRCREALDRVEAARGLAAQWVLREERLEDERVHAVLGRVFVHVQLFEDDLPLGLDVVVAERRLGEHVGEHVDAELDMRARQPRDVRRVLLRREGVHVAADTVDRLGDVTGRASVRSLEQQVLEEVGDAAQRLRLVTRSDADPHAHARRVGFGHSLRDDTNARSQLGALDA
jgi:hypothetical protein